MKSTTELLIFRIATCVPSRVTSVVDSVAQVNRVIDRVVNYPNAGISPLLAEAVRRLINEPESLHAEHLAVIADEAYDVRPA